VVQLVHSLDLATNVELVDRLVQELDGRVLGVTAEDELALLLPRLEGKGLRQQISTKKLEPRPSVQRERHHNDPGVKGAVKDAHMC